MMRGSPTVEVMISTALVFGLIAGIIAVLIILTGNQLTIPVLLFFSFLFLAIQWYLGPIIVRWVSGAREVSVSEAPQLHAALERIAKQSGIPKPKLYIVDSPIPNAFAFGRSQSDAGVAIHTGLLKKLNKEEVEAVIAHEVGHIKHNDVIIMTIASVIPVLLYYLVVFYLSRDDKEGPNPIAVFIGGILARIFGEILVLWLSRQREYYADAHSAYIMKDPMPLTRALIKITYEIPAGSTNESLNTLYVAEHGNIRQSLINAVEKNDKNAILYEIEKEPDNPLEIISTHPVLKKRIKALLT
ncbi:MAG: zinc metalloprotease HtpX [Candidatus Micrarchaeota archaeon]|nr:zinc metalloprotease HtpX [Candidatus Micrarchaeota archaeon]